MSELYDPTAKPRFARILGPDGAELARCQTIRAQRIRMVRLDDTGAPAGEPGELHDTEISIIDDRTPDTGCLAFAPGPKVVQATLTLDMCPPWLWAMAYPLLGPDGDPIEDAYDAAG